MTVSFAQTLWHSLVRAGLPHPEKFRIYYGGACLFLCKIIHLPGSPPSPWSVSVKDPSSQWWPPLLTCVPWYQGSATKMLRAKVCFCLCVCVLVAQLCLILCVPMDCSPPDSYVYGIFQVRILLRWRHYPIVIVTSLVGNFYFATTASIIQTFCLNCWTFVFLRISELAIGNLEVVLYILRSLYHRNQWPLVVHGVHPNGLTCVSISVLCWECRPMRPGCVREK